MVTMAKYKITERKITDYVPDLANANSGSERGLAMLEDSLAQDGAGRSIVADAHDRIPAGNKTIEAAMNTGIEDVIEVETDGNALIVHKRRDWNLDDPQGAARRYAYRDNRTSEVSLTWNVEQLLADLNAGVDLSSMWHEDELQALLEDLRVQGIGWDNVNVPDGDRAPFQQMTFTCHDNQVETIKRALVVAKRENDFDDSDNENSNGNALTAICEAYLNGRS